MGPPPYTQITRPNLWLLRNLNILGFPAITRPTFMAKKTSKALGFPLNY
jgi:hypothetical protein